MALTLLFGLIQGAGLERPREGVPNLEYPRSPRKQNSTFFPVVRPGFLSAQNGVRKAPAGLIDPISGKDVSGLHFYDLALSTKLADYRGRLTIDWGRVGSVGAHAHEEHPFGGEYGDSVDYVVKRQWLNF